jgi:hypothetical protein
MFITESINYCNLCLSQMVFVACVLSNLIYLIGGKTLLVNIQSELESDS